MEEAAHSPAAQAALQIPRSGIRPSDFKPRMIGVGNNKKIWDPKQATLHRSSCNLQSLGFASDATLAFRKRKQDASAGSAVTESERQAELELKRKERSEARMKKRHRRRLAQVKSSGASVHDVCSRWSSDYQDKRYYTGYTWKMYADGQFTRYAKIRKRFPPKHVDPPFEKHELSPLMSYKFHDSTPVLCQPAYNNAKTRSYDFLMEFSSVGGHASSPQLLASRNEQLVSKKTKLLAPKSILKYKAKLGGLLQTQDTSDKMEIACRRLIKESHDQMMRCDKVWQPSSLERRTAVLNFEEYR